MTTGYKATDKDMKCRGFQFELGKWYEHDGPIEECRSGFHFCEQPSGPWAYYYSDPGTRIFKVECEGVLDKPSEPGADVKRVCRRIRLIEEIILDGNYNTGDRNTGYGNTGDRNTGDRNTGDRNTGYGNATSRCSGFFCTEEPKVICFDVQTELTHDKFCEAYPQWYSLCQELQEIGEIDFAKYSMLPGITPEKLKNLHRKHLGE